MTEHPYDQLYLTSRYPGAHDLDLRLAVEKLCSGLFDQYDPHR